MADFLLQWAELSSCSGDYMAHKAESIYQLALYYCQVLPNPELSLPLPASVLLPSIAVTRGD